MRAMKPLRNNRMVGNCFAILVPDLGAQRFTTLQASRKSLALSHCFACRIEGVNVIPTSSPSGEMNRLTVWPHGSFLFRMSIR